MNTITVTAPAKLNLSLHITGKRADGFHLLESMVAFTRFGDALKIMPADEITLAIEGEFAGALADVENNLVFKAAKKLQQRFGIQTGAHITLNKRLPIGSGMGGGSSDAAAALRALAQLWNIDADAPEIFDIAQKLGSDVPMCYAGHPAFIRGVGEDITRVVLSAPVYVVLVHPRVPLLTADVFAHFSGQFDAPMAAPSEINSFTQLIDFIRPLHNALEAPAMAAMPVIKTIIEALAATKACALARMSGSGAGCFALYEKPEDAVQAADAIFAEHPQWWIVGTQLETI